MNNSNTDFKLAFRKDLTEAIKELNLETGITEVSKGEFGGILKKVRATFTNIDNEKEYYWLWDNLKGLYVAIRFKDDKAYNYLEGLIDPEETVWFIATDGLAKYWVYESNIKSIHKILANMYGFEYYIVSKRYEWLLCENHHGNLIGTGEKMIDRMKAFNENNKSVILQAYNL